MPCKDKEKNQFTPQANTQVNIYSDSAFGPTSTSKTYHRSTKFY